MRNEIVLTNEDFIKNIHCKRGDIFVIQKEPHILADVNGAGYRLISLFDGNRFDDVDIPYSSSLKDISEYINIADTAYLGRVEINIKE